MIKNILLSVKKVGGYPADRIFGKSGTVNRSFQYRKLANWSPNVRPTQAVMFDETGTIKLGCPLISLRSEAKQNGSDNERNEYFVCETK